MLPSLHWQQEGGASVGLTNFLYILCSGEGSCLLSLQMAWQRELNGNKPDGLVFPFRIIRQEPPQAATCGGSLLCQRGH